VPHQEDSGVDFYCTMTDRLGPLAWPRAYFTVQVKSTDAAWKFNGGESVRWLIEQPLPLYLCVVDKHTLRFRIYHTLARFHIWSLGIQSSPDYLRSLQFLELTPGPSGTGKCTDWDGGYQIPLSAPILDITLPEFVENEERIAESREVLKYCLNLDKANLVRIATGTLNFVLPQSYETNTIKWSDRTATRTFGKRYENITEAELRSSFSNLNPSLVWLTRALMATGDSVGAALIAMLMRHRDFKAVDLFDTAIRLSGMAGIPEPPGGVWTSLDPLYAVLNELLALVRGRLETPHGSEFRDQPG
jgi:hypothetical protein